MFITLESENIAYIFIVALMIHLFVFVTNVNTVDGRLNDVSHCQWSGGFRIDRDDSFHINMR